jgi:translation initiation factor RLI1
VASATQKKVTINIPKQSQQTEIKNIVKEERKRDIMSKVIDSANMVAAATAEKQQISGGSGTPSPL